MDAELLRQAFRAALEDPDGVMAAIRDELRMARQAGSDGRPFTSIMTGVTDGAGLCVLTIDGPRVGQVWHLERVSVVIGGASQAAVTSLYLDSPAADVDLLDYNGGGAAIGNSPSRVIFGAPGAAYLIPNGTPVVVVVSGAVAAQPVSVRYQGRAVEVDTSGGRV